MNAEDMERYDLLVARLRQLVALVREGAELANSEGDLIGWRWRLDALSHEADLNVAKLEQRNAARRKAVTGGAIPASDAP
jgi:hypothetical protein